MGQLNSNTDTNTMQKQDNVLPNDQDPGLGEASQALVQPALTKEELEHKIHQMKRKIDK